MKEKFKNFIGGLEKTLESCKKHWKEIVTAIALPFVFNANVNAGGLFLEVKSSLAKPSFYIKHMNGATEGYDGYYDGVLLEVWPPNFYIYSKTSFPPPEDRLKRDARPPESMTTITSEIVGVGLSSPVIDGELDPMIYYPNGEDNFSWKNIIGELYNNGDVNEPNNLLGVYDMKHMDSTDAKIPLTINNGLSYQLLVKFYNHCDFNRDRQINGLDFDILNENWGRDNVSDPNTFGSYVGSDVNDFNAYADIDRNGSVGLEDLDIFKTYFRFSGDLNHDGKVGMDDFAYLANDWNVGDANFYDLSAFSYDYLRDINEPATW